MKKFFPLLIISALSFILIQKSFSQVDVTATIGTSSASYSTLKLAFDAINAGTHHGVITISITANTNEGTTPATLHSSGAGSASYTSVLIQPTVDGVTISGNPSTGYGVIQLNGADNVTINGDNPNTIGINRNLTISNTAAANVIANSVLRIATSAAVLSADNITIKNCILNGNVTGGNLSSIGGSTSSSNSSFGIYVGGKGGSTPTTAPTNITSVTNDTASRVTTINNLLIDNNAINQCARGIVFNGAVSGVSNGVTISNNLIGDQLTTLTGNPPYTSPSTTVYTKGIWINGTTSITITGNTLKSILSYIATGMTAIELNGSIGSGIVNIAGNTIIGLCQNGSANIPRGIYLNNSGGPFTISGNIISNIQMMGSASVIGIDIAAAPVSGLIQNNNVSTIYNRSSSAYAAYGINLSGGNNVTVQNNFLCDINMYSNNPDTSTVGQPVGIRINAGVGHKIYHNTVNLFGAPLGGSSGNGTSCLMIVRSGSTGIDVRNNILSNQFGGWPGVCAHACIYVPSGLSSSFNLTLNNNAYYTAAGNYLAQLSLGTTYTVAAFNPGSTSGSTNWRNYSSALLSANTNNDNVSFGAAGAPPFTSSTNLHIPAGTSTMLESGGASGTGVTTDIDGESRPGPPGSINGGGYANDIGADEFDGISQALSSGTYAIGPSGNYPGYIRTFATLASVAAALNSARLNGDVIFELQADYVCSAETFPITFNEYSCSGGTWSVTIRPAAGTSGLVTGGDPGSGNALIVFNGVDRLKFDGAPGGSSKMGPSTGWTIRNTRSGATVGPAIQFQNDATYNTLTSLQIESQNITSTSGTIFFGVTTGTTGNDYNSITYCNVGDRSDVTGTPLNAIYSSGSTGSAALANSQITIDHNNIYNFYLDGQFSSGINETSGSSDWTITNNNLYQTAPRYNTLATGWNIITVNNSASVNNIISGNYLGGSSPSCSGIWQVMSSALSTTCYPIRFYGGPATASTISNNVIQNFNIVTTLSATSDVFDGILLQAGTANVISNTIGSPTGNGSISTTINGAYGGGTNGIVQTASGSIQNNTVGSFTIGGSSTAASSSCFGIYYNNSAPAVTVVVTGNTIGSLSSVSSIYSTAPGMPFTMIGMYFNVGTSVTNTNISSNIISNLTNLTTSSSSVISGIYCYETGASGTTISGNTINELICNGTNVSANAFTGIYGDDVSTGRVYAQNIIKGVRSSTTSAVATTVCGIYTDWSGSAAFTRNRIYDLTNTATGSAPLIAGIASSYSLTGTAANNQITLTNGEVTTDLKTKPGTKKAPVNIKNINNEIASDLKMMTSPRVLTRGDNLLQSNLNQTENRTFSTDLLRFKSESLKPKIRTANLENTSTKLPKAGPLSLNGVLIDGFLNSGTGAWTYYYNSVYVGGTVSSGSTNSTCFLRSGASTTIAKDNLFVNARTGGTGKHYAISNTGGATGWTANTSNYNVLIGSNIATIGLWNATDQTFADWIVSSSCDKQSWSASNTGINPSNLFNSISTGNLGIQTGNTEAWIVSGKGIAISGQGTDFAGNTRATTISGGCTDIGSAEFTATPPGNPVATESARPGPGLTTTYTLYGRIICTISWSPDAGGSAYPLGMNVNYFTGVVPSNTLGGNFSNSHITIVPSGGTLSNATYDLTYYFGDNETSSITSPNANTTLAKYDPASWEVFQPGIGAYLNQLTYNSGAAVYTCKVLGLADFSDFALTDLTSPLPVQISRFTGSSKNRDVTLYWQTCRELNNKGFDVERRNVTDVKSNTYSPWEKVVFIQGRGTTQQQQSYSYVDIKMNSGKYQYRLKQIDYNGGLEYYNLDDPGTVEIGKPIQADVSQNYPNPSNPKSKIDYQIPFDGKVSIKVYDIIGREVAVLVNEVKEPGFYTAVFDGTNLASGVYFYRIQAEDGNQKFTQTKKMLLIK